MDRVYFTVKRINSSESGLSYMSKVNGNEGLHYDAEGLLQYLADAIISKYDQSIVVLRNNLPEEDKRLSETLETMVNGHNIILKLGKHGNLNAKRETRRRILSRASR